MDDFLAHGIAKHEICAKAAVNPQAEGFPEADLARMFEAIARYIAPESGLAQYLMCPMQEICQKSCGLSWPKEISSPDFIKHICMSHLFCQRCKKCRLVLPKILLDKHLKADCDDDKAIQNDKKLRRKNYKNNIVPYF